MTQPDIDFLGQLFGSGKWAIKRSEDGKTVLGTVTLDIATTDERESAELIVKMQNQYRELVAEVARLRQQLGIIR